MPSPPVFRFGAFVLDVAAYELRHEDRPVRIERQPMDLLILLVERPRQLVTRREIVDRLWGPDVFVDVEAGIHTAIRKVRQALGDTVERPTFVETVPGRGYRFIAGVERVQPAAEALPPTAAPGAESPANVHQAAPSSVTAPPDDAARARRGRVAATLGPAGALALLVVGLVGVLVSWPRVGPAGELPRPATVLAVLPFSNLSGDPAYDYIAEGLADETSTSLGQVDPERLGVVARTSAMHHRNSTSTAGELGRELGADYLLEGTVWAEGRRLRVTSQLVRVSDQLLVWSQSWDREPTSLLGVQRELSEDIVRQIHGRLSPDRASTLARRQTSSPDAYDLYLRGLNFERQRTPPTTRRAVEYYEKATALDPDYSLAWAALAGTLTGSALNSDMDPGTVRDRAREAARRAIETGPDTAEAHRVMAMGQWYFEWDRWPEAEAGYRRALSIDPRSATTHLMLGHLLSQMGRHPEARQATLRARELEPLNPLMFALSSQVAFQSRDYTEALRFAERAIALDGEFWIGYVMRGQALEQLGRNEAAIEALTMAERFSGQNSKPMSLRAYLLARTGRANQAEAMLDALATASRDRYVPPYAMALINLGLGRRDRALDWLERALDVRDVHLIYLPVDPKWDVLRSDPRFGGLLERCGFAADRT